MTEQFRPELFDDSESVQDAFFSLLLDAFEWRLRLKI
jgi:hypothetical protein